MLEYPVGYRNKGGDVRPTVRSSPEDEAFEAELQRAFLDTPLHRLLGLHVHAVEETDWMGRAVIDMPVASGALGGTKNLHGGAISTLCDVASAWAARRASRMDPKQQTLVSTDLHVRFVSRPTETFVRATASVAHGGSRLIVVNCDVSDGERESLVAVASFSAMVVPVRLPLAHRSEADHHSLSAEAHS
jgi:uncharacterized protein (TIGR00369 family)